MSQVSEPTSVLSGSTQCTAVECWQALQRLRSQCPLVQCITNYVSMDLMANTLLAIGASPAMAHGAFNVLTFLRKCLHELIPVFPSIQIPRGAMITSHCHFISIMGYFV